MNRPRPLLRSLVAATCGTTLITAAVLGTGAAAFAEETEGAGRAASLMTAESSAVQDSAESQSDASAEPATPEATAPEATESVAAEQPATEEAAVDDTVEEPAQQVDAPETVDAPTEAAAEPARAQVRAEDARLAEVVAPDEADPQVAVTVPGSVGLGGELREITFKADPEAEPTVLLTLSDWTAELLGFVEFRELKGGEWVDVPFDETGSHSFQVTGGEVKLLVGVSQASYERDWKQFLEDEGLSALAEDEGPEPLDTIDFTTELVLDGPGDNQFDKHSIALLSPEIDLTKAAPDEVEAGDSFTFSYRITNRTGSDYSSDASLDLLEFGSLWVDEEGYAVDPADMVLTCSVEGGAPVEVDLNEVDYPFLGPAGSLPLGALPSGGSLDVECQVDLAADLPDSELDLVPLLTLGESRAPLTELGDAAQTIVIFELSEPAPAPAKPAPAQPAPVRPAPTTPANPPAAAPVRQVPTTTLPRTGTDPLPLAAAGLGLVLAGAGALFGGRRRAHS